jgi:arsenate reductase (thioredoxin)
MNAASSRLVLFVCVENTFRSIIAEAIFNAHRPTGWRAESAGVRPAENINPVAIQLLNEIGMEVAPKKPRLVTPDLVAESSRIITFGCLDRCPIGAKEKSEDWQIPGSTGRDGSLRAREELLAIRGEVERRVLKLIHQLQRTVEPNTS